MLKTLADFPEIAAPLLVHPTLPFGPTSLVRCPCCNRATTADTVVDVRSAPGTVIRGGGNAKPRDHDWLCDGGLHLVYHHQPNGWTRSKLYRALGAPAVVVRQHRAKELAHEQQRADAANGRPHDAGAAFVAALATLPDNTTALPGTEAPNVKAGAK